MSDEAYWRARKLIADAADNGAAGLDLREMHLEGVPGEIGQLQNLRDLHLGGNHLTRFPPEIADLERLEKLNISGNPLRTLPPDIGRLKNLRSCTRLNP